MMVVCGTVVILAMTMALGHYNSLAHAFPKAVLDGAVIALLLGAATREPSAATTTKESNPRWRCLALLGVVYGLVLLIQVGVFYLVPVMAVAGAVAAMVGRAGEVVSRRRFVAVLVAASWYELLAGCGAPLKIYFGTGGRAEPVLWGMWFAELPLRAIGAAIGVLVTRRWTDSLSSMGVPPMALRSEAHARTPQSKGRHGRDAHATASSVPKRSPLAVALRVAASILACVLPMFLESWTALGLVAVAFLAYALAAGVGRRRLLGAAAGLCWTWLAFALASYAWNRDLALVRDLLRTVVLRFAPLTLASIALVTTVRPVDLIRLLRGLRLGGSILIPLSQVARAVPHSRRLITRQMAEVHDGDTTNRRPRLFARLRAFATLVLLPLVRHWSDQLTRIDDRSG